MNGGIERWFEPIDPAVGAGASMLAILGFCRALFEPWRRRRPAGTSKCTSSGSRRARANRAGRRRKVCTATAWTTCWCCCRPRNIARGVTTIHALDGRTLGHFTLTDPFDAALVDDAASHTA